MPKFDIDIILKLPLSKRLLILGAVLLVITGIFYYFLYSAKLNEKVALSAKLEGIKNTVAEKQRIAGNLSKLKKEIEDMNNQFKLALEALPNEKEIANLLEGMSDAAKTARLDIITFKPGKETPKGFYAEVRIDMKVEGGYNSVISFFEKVAGMPRIVNISSLNITSGKEVRGDIMMSATFTAMTFKFLSQPEAKK